MSSSQKTWFFGLFGLFLLCSGVSAKTKLQDESKVVVQTKDQQNPVNYISTQPLSVSTYPEQYRVNMSSAESNFTGIRSVFQWTIGNISSIGGIHNALDFTVNDSVTLQTLNGHIGIYSNDSRTGIHLSFDSVDSSSPGPNFTCSNNFTLINGKQSCYNFNYTLTSNAIYYLDVEINNRTLRGYISEPQRNRTTIDDTKVQRSLIGEMNWRNELKDLRPLSYWGALSYGDSCKNLSDISTFNYDPVSYTNSSRTLISFASSTITNTTDCGPQNVIAMTAWSPDAAIYISRPPAQIDES